jgi:hypothetical protein
MLVPYFEVQALSGDSPVRRTKEVRFQRILSLPGLDYPFRPLGFRLG